MIPYNPGNLLKFHNFNAKTYQRHRQAGQDRHPFGLKCPAGKLLPFQIYRAAGAGDVTWRLVNPLNDTDNITMDAGDLVVTHKMGGGFWVTWDAQSNLTEPATCGFWYVELTIDEQLFYSETLFAYGESEPTPVYRFSFYNQTDKDNVLYQDGYKQYFYPTRWAWDRPVIDRETTITVNGYGEKTVEFSRTVERFRMEVADVPDYAIGFFAKAGDLSSVTFQDVGATIGAVQMDNITFEHRPQGQGLNVGVFTFDAVSEAFNGCQENFELA